MAETRMPRDQRDNPLPCLKLETAHKINVGAASLKNTVAFDTKTRVIGVYSTVDCLVKQGKDDVTATATDHFLPAGFYYDISIGSQEDNDHRPFLAVIRASTDGLLYISEKS